MNVVLPIHVVAFETDFAGVVSNTRYVEYLERGRAALMRAANLTVESAMENCGAQPVVRRVQVEYLAPARHEDDLELHVEVASHEGARSHLRFELLRPRDGALIIRAEQTLVYLTARWKPVRVPNLFREKMPAESVNRQDAKGAKK